MVKIPSSVSSLLLNLPILYTAVSWQGGEYDPQPAQLVCRGEAFGRSIVLLDPDFCTRMLTLVPTLVPRYSFASRYRFANALLC